MASYTTMKSYRDIWNNFFNYLKEHWKMKNFEEIKPHHVVAYMDYKIEYYPSKQYLEKISSAIGKLELALNKLSINIHKEERNYDFSIRQIILNEARDLKYVVNNYHNRAYSNPKLLISNLNSPLHRLVATIQYEGGARIEGIGLIKKEQLKGIKLDSITNKQKGILFTKEKGGKEGDVLISTDTYNKLKVYLLLNKILKINKSKYYEDIKKSTLISNENREASHGLRWNFAKRRMFECSTAGLLYEECLQQVSTEMKHNRKNITKHYLS